MSHKIWKLRNTLQYNMRLFIISTVNLLPDFIFSLKLQIKRMCCCTSKFKWFHTAIFIWKSKVSTPEFVWVVSLQAKAICILKVYDIRCGFHALSTLWRQVGKEHYPTVSSSFVLVLNSWFILWLRVVPGARVLLLMFGYYIRAPLTLELLLFTLQLVSFWICQVWLFHHMEKG